MIKIGVINVSDRASQGIYEDIPGKAVVDLLHEYLISEFELVYQVIPDEQKQLEEAMTHMADIENVSNHHYGWNGTLTKRCYP